MRKVGAEPKANSGSRARRPRWADYEDIADIHDGGFKKEAIGHREGFRQPTNRWDFGNKTRGQFGQRGNLHSVGGHDNLDGIKLKIPTFQGKNNPDTYWECERKVDWIFYCRSYLEAKKMEDYIDSMRQQISGADWS